jgi:hypothetical protein
LGMQPSHLLHPSTQTTPLWLPAPEGRRLLGLTATFPLIYVDQSGRLETSYAKRGFDRYTFWLSNYAAAITSLQPVWTPDLFLQTLKAMHIGLYAEGSSSTWGNFAPDVSDYPLNIYFLCTDARILCVRDSRVVEFGPGGLTDTHVQEYVPTDPPSTSYRIGFIRRQWIELPYWPRVGVRS